MSAIRWAARVFAFIASLIVQEERSQNREVVCTAHSAERFTEERCAYRSSIIPTTFLVMTSLLFFFCFTSAL